MIDEFPEQRGGNRLRRACIGVPGVLGEPADVAGITGHRVRAAADLDGEVVQKTLDPVGVRDFGVSRGRLARQLLKEYVSTGQRFWLK